MKTVLQFVRKQRRVTAIEYAMIGYFFCISLMIGVETVGARFNTNLFVPPANALDGGKVRADQ
jgi:Flp pilus assembly pilin Flp